MELHSGCHDGPLSEGLLRLRLRSPGTQVDGVHESSLRCCSLNAATWICRAWQTSTVKLLWTISKMTHKHRTRIRWRSGCCLVLPCYWIRGHVLISITSLSANGPISPVLPETHKPPGQLHQDTTTTSCWSAALCLSISFHLFWGQSFAALLFFYKLLILITGVDKTTAAQSQ